MIISPWLLHRRAQAWPDPTAFDPDRFAADRAAAPRPDYLPFGVGPRLCIGRDFALVESVLVLATLLQRVRFEPVRRDGAVDPPGRRRAGHAAPARRAAAAASTRAEATAERGAASWAVRGTPPAGD